MSDFDSRMFDLAKNETFILFFVVLFLLLIHIPLVLFLFSFRKLLLEISPKNRKVEPDHVWFGLVPYFGMIWHIIMIIRLADSLVAEFKDRDILFFDSNPGQSLGLAYAILTLCGIIPLFGSFLSIAGIICWIVYWVKLGEFRRLLNQQEMVNK